LPRITPARLQRFLDEELFASGRVECIMIGNVSAAAAVTAAEAARSVFTVHQTVPLLPSELDGWRTVRLPQEAVISLAMQGRNPEDPNSAHLTMWQGAAQSSLRGTVLAELVDRVIHRPAFHQLRTVEQIGYLVWTYTALLADVPHNVFLLQSSSLNAEEIGMRVSAFLQQWRGSFEVCLSEL
jgi:insulysin